MRHHCAIKREKREIVRTATADVSVLSTVLHRDRGGYGLEMQCERSDEPCCVGLLTGQVFHARVQCAGGRVRRTLSRPAKWPLTTQLCVEPQ
jgi:hypothetical protein